jgi:3-methyladenine DNA glycosylase AlkC
MEPFKNFLNAGVAANIGSQLQRVDPGFDRRRFEALATAGLDALELKARAMQMADALEATLPAAFGEACDQLEAALAPPWADDRLGSEVSAPLGRDGLEGWALWPVGEFVARRGSANLELDVDRALQALHAITQRFSAEFAIRPLIVAAPQRVFETLQRWTADPSAHVRRLVSEGSRPRLPWGLRLRALVDDPSPTLALLRALQDDPSEYVRRSVANHLNDIAKDHPDLVVAWVGEHLPDAPPARRALLRHASRTLIKAGHAPMLAAWGEDRALQGRVVFQVAPTHLSLGESLALQVQLTSTDRQPQRLVIDYAVHHLGADGGLRPKVFKGWTLDLAPGEQRVLRKAHPLRPVTIRRYRSGRHEVDLRINGQIVARAVFDLQVPAPAPSADPALRPAR